MYLGHMFQGQGLYTEHSIIKVAHKYTTWSRLLFQSSIFSEWHACVVPLKNNRWFKWMSKCNKYRLFMNNNPLVYFVISTRNRMWFMWKKKFGHKVGLIFSSPGMKAHVPVAESSWAFLMTCCPSVSYFFSHFRLLLQNH